MVICNKFRERVSEWFTDSLTTINFKTLPGNWRYDGILYWSRQVVDLIMVLEG